MKLRTNAMNLIVFPSIFLIFLIILLWTAFSSGEAFNWDSVKFLVFILVAYPVIFLVSPLRYSLGTARFDERGVSTKLLGRTVFEAKREEITHIAEFTAKSSHWIVFSKAPVEINKSTYSAMHAMPKSRATRQALFINLAFESQRERIYDFAGLENIEFLGNYNGTAMLPGTRPPLKSARSEPGGENQPEP